MCQATAPPPPASSGWTIPALGSIVSVVSGFLQESSLDARQAKERLVGAKAAAPPSDGRLTLEAVARHHSEGDAWIVVQGQVRERDEERKKGDVAGRSTAQTLSCRALAAQPYASLDAGRAAW